MVPPSLEAFGDRAAAARAGIGLTTPSRDGLCQSFQESASHEWVRVPHYLGGAAVPLFFPSRYRVLPFPGHEQLLLLPGHGQPVAVVHIESGARYEAFDVITWLGGSVLESQRGAGRARAVLWSHVSYNAVLIVAAVAVHLPEICRSTSICSRSRVRPECWTPGRRRSFA